MKRDKKERLEKAGWRVGTTRDFLKLSDAEHAVIEVRVMLARTLKSHRIQRHMSQAALAKELGSSQSRVAKMEAGDPTVSLDLLFRSLFTLGSTTAQVGKVIASTNAA